MHPSQLILETAESLGASVAGIVHSYNLRKSPSHKACGRPNFPPNLKSILVLGLHHGREDLALDWWGGEGGTPGNRALERIAQEVIHRLGAAFGVEGVLLPYHVHRGGTFLKDAAVLAGLGSIGRNNLVITPRFGPRVRWRAVGLSCSVRPSAARPSADPCAQCDMPCTRACPQGAFSSGAYSREKCLLQMRRDEAQRFAAAANDEKAAPWAGRVRYCRACELACPFPFATSS